MLKQLFLTFYQTQIGVFIWRCLKKTANNIYIKKILVKLLGYDNLLNIPVNHIFLEHLYFSAKNKNVLVLMPAWGKSAACLYISELCGILKQMGYSLHLVVYGRTGVIPSDPLWDHAYALRPTLPAFGLSHPIGRDASNFDANLIDDWVGEDLMSFIKLLEQNCHFDLCLCNYVFLSRSLTYFDNSTKKLLITHDIFTDRNKRMNDVGIKSFYFGTDSEEEKKGLDRADCIIAIQEKERLFFNALTVKPVITVPYIPQKKYKDFPFSELPLKVGYIASHHGPNILAIKEYIKLLRSEEKIEIYIAGPISAAIEQVTSNVHVLGIIDDLDEFYSKYDIYANPDLLESGLKIKTVETFSYGRPFVCTKAASAGISVTKPYHQCESIGKVAEITKKCAKNPVILAEMAGESKRVYNAFYDAYPVYEVMERIVKSA